MKKGIVVFLLIVLVGSLLVSCSTTSTIITPARSTRVYDFQGNVVGIVEIPESSSSVEWNDWAKFSFLFGLIGGATVGLISSVVSSAARTAYY